MQDAVRLLVEAQDIAEEVRNDEEDSLDNIPENLQESERCEKISCCVDTLEDVISGIDEVLDMIYDVCS